MSEDIIQPNYDEWTELAGLTDFITQYGSGSSLRDISLADLYKYLQNPYANIKEIQKASKYLTNKHGIVKDVLRTIKSLPSLNYRLHWSSYEDTKRIKKYEQKIDAFLDDIDVKSVVRSGLFEVSEMGTLVICLRSKKYIQFLDIDDLRINKQRNGKWIVEYDLSTIKRTKGVTDKLAIIESLPDEVTLARYNDFLNKGADYQYVELKNTDVISTDGNRNMPYGLPFTIGAWASLLQKEIIDQVERSVADRLMKSVVIVKGGHLDAKKEKPATNAMINNYFNEVSKLFKKTNGINQQSNQSSSGTGVVGIPYFIDISTLKVDTNLFPKELYDKVNDNIYANLGVSSSLISGQGGDYSSAQMNIEKLYRYIFTILERYERIVNEYIKTLIPSNLTCKIVFDRSTIADKNEKINQYRELYMQTNILQPWVESLLGVDYKYALSQAEYENKVLEKESVIYPASNAYTTSSGDNKGGAPTVDNPTNESTIKSKSNGSNNNPKPSAL